MANGTRKARAVLLVHMTTVPLTLGFLRGQVGYMQRKGLDVRVVSSPGPLLDRFALEEQTMAYAVVMQRRISPAADLRALVQLLRVLRRLRPSIVHTHTPKAGLLGMVAAWFAGVPVRVYHVHGLRFETAAGRTRQLLRLTEICACRLAHRVLCVGESVRQVAVSEKLCPPGKIRVLARGSINGVDAEGAFNSERLGPGARQQARRAWGIPAAARVVGFVGRVVRDKGISELAEAWRYVREDFPDAYLFLVGPIEPDDPVDPQVLEALSHDPRVVLAGLVHGPMAPLFAAMDVVALPTYREGFPVVPLEAAAMALPVVATRVPGCVDAVLDGVTGTLVAPRSGDELAQAIARYLEADDLRRCHGQAGRDRVLREYVPKRIWEATYEEYRCLLRARLGLSIWEGADQ